MNGAFKSRPHMPYELGSAPKPPGSVLSSVVWTKQKCVIGQALTACDPIETFAYRSIVRVVTASDDNTTALHSGCGDPHRLLQLGVLLARRCSEPRPVAYWTVAQ